MVFCFHLYIYHSSWFMGFYVDSWTGVFLSWVFGWLIYLGVVFGVVCDAVDCGWLKLSLLVGVLVVLVLGDGGVAGVVLSGVWVCGFGFVFGFVSMLCFIVCFGLFAVWVRGVWVKLIGALLADLSVLSV